MIHHGGISHSGTRVFASHPVDPGGNYPAHTAANTVVGGNILDPIDAALDQPPELVADTDSDDEEVLQADGPRRTAHGG